MATGGTRALDELRRANVPHTVHEYEAPEPSGRDRDRGARPHYGEDAAAALSVDPRRICKTLVASVDGRLAVAVVPVADELDLKALAAAVGGRRAEMADPAEAERATGYVRGGISPLGQRRRLPMVIDESTTAWPTIYVSAGRRGLQVELAPADLVRLTGATAAPISRR
jgi:Cys-tRNA(Pro)/Cys-tRNA(Cys) deacylase